MTAARVLTGIDCTDPADAWRSLGLRVVDGAIALGNMTLSVGVDAAVASRDGIAGLVLDGRDAPDDLDGIPLRAGASAAAASADHPNGAIEIDHLVLGTPDIDRTSEVMAGLGWHPRRTITSPRPHDARTMRFFVVPAGGPANPRKTVIELIQPDEVTDPTRPATAWGFVLNVRDLDAAVARLGATVVDNPKPAIQPGRRIATVRGEALGLRPRVALMTPRS